MRAEELANAIGGRLIGERTGYIKGFSIDSREIEAGQVFIAMKGSRFDGHDFICEAFQKGAVGVISEKPVSPPAGRFAVRVSSSLEALKRIALYRRRSFRGNGNKFT